MSTIPPALAELTASGAFVETNAVLDLNPALTEQTSK